MICLKKITTTAFLTTALMTSVVSIAQAMDEQVEKPVKNIKIQPSSTNSNFPLEVLVEDEGGSGNFRSAPQEEGEQLLNNLVKFSSTILKLNNQDLDRVRIKEADSYRYLPAEEVDKKVQIMLTARKQAEEQRQTEEEERQHLIRAAEESRLIAERAEQERLKAAVVAAEIEEAARIQAETLRLQKEIADTKAELAKQQKAAAEEALRREQEELANLRAQMAAQTIAQAEREKQQEQARIAQQAAFEKQQEEEKAAQQAAFEKQQAEFARQQEEARAAHQAQLAAQQAAFEQQQAAERARQEAEQAEQARKQQEILLGGRTPERVAHNTVTEIRRFGRLLSGRDKHGRKKK